MKEDFTFPRVEKLKSRKMIENIFKNGFAVKSYPVRIQFAFHEITEFPRCQVGVSVSKRYLKKAVDRNRVKRLLREAYRLNKGGLIEKLTAVDKRLAMMIIYTSSDKLDFASVETKLLSAMCKIRV